MPCRDMLRWNQRVEIADRAHRHAGGHDAAQHDEGRDRLREQQPDRDRRVRGLRHGPEQRDPAEEAADVIIAVHLERQGAEVGGETRRERLVDPDREQERARDEDRAERRLQEVHDGAVRGHRDHGARRERHRAEHEQAGDLAAHHEPRPRSRRTRSRGRRTSRPRCPTRAARARTGRAAPACTRRTAAARGARSHAGAGSRARARQSVCRGRPTDFACAVPGDSRRSAMIPHRVAEPRSGCAGLPPRKVRSHSFEGYAVPDRRRVTSAGAGRADGRGSRHSNAAARSSSPA